MAARVEGVRKPSRDGVSQVTASKSSARIIAAGLYLSLFVISCAQLLGEITIEDRETDIRPILGGDAGTEPTGPVIVCEAGVTRCDDRVLQLCRDDGAGWTHLQTCATPELCESGELSTVSACLTPQCAVDQMSCDVNVLRLCNAARTGWEEFDTCESAAHCDAGKRQCLPAPCNPGDRRCNVGNLERCNDARTDWEQLDECVTNELCEATLAPPGGAGGALEGAGVPVPDVTSTVEGPTECRSPACVPREVKCVGVRLEACNEGQTDWNLAEDCATPVLCDASITYTGLRGSPRCVRPTCAANEHRCSELGVLERCNENRDGYVPIEQCIGPQFCNSVAADNGQPGCEAAPCEAGVQQCNGPQIQVCRQNRTGFDPLGAPCETRGLCNDDSPVAFCSAPVCQRGPLSTNEFVCQGATLQRCNDQHTGYDVQNTCATPGLCNAALGFNGCVAPVCAVGETRCNGDFVQVCNAQRTGFDNIERCAAGTCDSALRRCADPCVVGTARCNAQGGLEECRDPLVGRQVTALCGSVQLCDAQARSCRTPPAGCTADGVRRCRVQGNNTVLEVCSEGRSRFSVLDTCSPLEFCDVNDVTCDVCDQTSQPTCVNSNTLVTCAANGQRSIPQTCANGCQIVDGAPDRCRTCVPGSVSCDGTQLVVCRQRGGEEFLDREPCDTQALCRSTLAACNANGTGQACRCQEGVCDPGDRDCEGAQPVACNVDQTDFVSSGQSCLLEENCNPAPVGACFPCGGGDVRCGADSIMEGCRSDRSGFADIAGARPEEVRCISDNSGRFSQQCDGAELVTVPCTSGLCVDGVGCAQCNPDNFVSSCATTGAPARTVCVGGRIEPRVCTASACSVVTACSGAGSCDTAAAAAGTACQRTGGLSGVCDGARTPSCVECVSAEQCNDGVDCTDDSCQPNGTCRHVANNARCDDGVFCNGVETCTAAGGCSRGQAPSCPDTNVCADNGCDEAANACVAVPLSTGACTQANDQPGVCRAGVCSPPIVCAVGETRCANGSLQVCNAARTEFVTQSACAFGCNVQGTGCNLCTPALCSVAPDSCTLSATCSLDGLSCQRVQCAPRLCVQGVCRECVNANDCDPGEACTDNQCVAGCNAALCGVAGCNAAGTACDVCNVATDCSDPDLTDCLVPACAADGLTCTTQPLTCPAGETCVGGVCAADQQTDPSLIDQLIDGLIPG